MIFGVLLLFFSVAENQAIRDPRDFIIDNWTTCEEFLNNTKFDPASVVDIDWKIFYFWNYEIEESYNIRFSYPSSVLVDRYKVELDGEIKPPVNWTDAVLFMETSIDLSALFIKTNISGLFRIVPSIAFEYRSVPRLMFAMKVVEAGYLGISNCKYRLCYALAPVDKMPYHYELDKAAKTLGFWGEFNRSHIAVPILDSTIPPFEEHDDDIEDEELEVEQDPNKLSLF